MYCRSVPFVRRNTVGRDRRIREQRRDDQRDHAERRVLGDVSATRASTGMAGIRQAAEILQVHHRVRSLPMTLSVLVPPAEPGCSRWLVMAPSISTLRHRLMVTTMITRSSGVCAPAIRKSVLSGEFAENANVSSKPLAAAGCRRGDLHALQRVEHDARHRERDHRPDEQREMDALKHRALRHARGQRDADARRFPRPAPPAQAAFASARRHDAQRIAEIGVRRGCRARSPSTTRCSSSVAKRRVGGSKRRRR